MDHGDHTIDCSNGLTLGGSDDVVWHHHRQETILIMSDIIRNVLLEGVSKGHFPGAQWALIKRGQPIKTHHVGNRQIIPEPHPVDGLEIYDVASLTKVVVTTTLIMRLALEKQLSLDDALMSHLSRFQHPDITIAHLLTHSSGLPADIPRASRLASRQQVLDHVFSVGTLHVPGHDIIYSDIGFILLGLVVEKITGMGLDEAAGQFIFKPLGMNDTSFHPDPARCAPTEWRDDEVFSGLLQGRVHDEKAFAMGGVAGHAGLFSTAHDLGLFIKAMLEDNFVLDQTWTDALFEPRMDIRKDNGTTIRAYGWDKPVPGGSAGDHVDFRQTILHTGFTGCNMWVDRFHQTGFVLLSNAVHPKREDNGIIPYRRKIAGMIITQEV
ncbi:MAG: class A beta-lactamase-related serine hydrolase [Acholeplasmataceae bacterium]|nr:MAG: class A beta-lactamase-related serine hydrolase [Acholeplasmataceae bacterium]